MNFDSENENEPEASGNGHVLTRRETLIASRDEILGRTVPVKVKRARKWNDAFGEDVKTLITQVNSFGAEHPDAAQGFLDGDFKRKVKQLKTEAKTIIDNGAPEDFRPWKQDILNLQTDILNATIPAADKPKRIEKFLKKFNENVEFLRTHAEKFKTEFPDQADDRR